MRYRAFTEAGAVRRRWPRLALLAGIGQGEQFLAWCDEALKLLAAVESGAG